MLREYEFTFVTRTDLSDGDRAKVLEGYESILKREGGEILKKDDWGAKKLAYPIKKHFRGQYVCYNFASVPSSIAECERLLKIDENVLRHLIVKVGDKVSDIEDRKAQLAKPAPEPKSREEEN